MSILTRHHVPEEALAEMATDDRARARLAPADRQHLDMCDRCEGLIEGHRRATQALAAPWQFVTAGEITNERGVERVRGVVSGGLAAGRMSRSMPIVVLVATVLIVALIGTALIVGAGRQPEDAPLAVIPAASPSAVPSPTPAATPAATPIDASTWVPFESSHYGLTVSRPADWRPTPASSRWDLIVDQTTSFLRSTDRLTSWDGTSTFAAYGMAIPDGMTSDGFIEAYRAPNVKRWGVRCFPPPSTWEQVPIDGHVAGLTQGCAYGDYIEAILVVDHRIYIFSGYGRLATDRSMFDAILSTVRVLPATADDDPFSASPTVPSSRLD